MSPGVLGGLGRTSLLLLVGVVGYVLVAGAALGFVVASGLAPAEGDAVGAALRGQGATLVLGGVMAGAGLVAILTFVLRRYPSAAGRLAAETRLLLGANPEHRLDAAGPAELRELAAAVNDLADRRLVAEREVAREVSAARADVEQERNRLAALMADLDVAVLVCSLGGRVLLYNAAARSLLADDPALGLGRSVFGVIDEGLVAHALDRIRHGSAHVQVSTVSTALRHGQLLHLRLTPVRDLAGDLTGFVLVLTDLTSRQQASSQRDALLTELIETTRACLASIRAAVETMLDYPDMEPGERAQFARIIREESERLGGQVEAWAGRSQAHPAGAWLLTDMRGDDLRSVLAREIGRQDGLTATVDAGEAAEAGGAGADELWVRADSHAIARATVSLVTRLREHYSVDRFELSLTPAGRHAGLDLRWSGPPPDADVFNAWLAEPLAGSGADSVHDVVARHEGEIWSGVGLHGSAYLRLLLPLAAATPQPAVPQATEIGGRLELYDFDLFDLPAGSMADRDSRLGDLVYTVFDTETTGLHVAAGDQIVSFGAVRVVNGRLLRNETFERLVDPRRSVPASSVAIHGITTDMLRGQPTLDEVLPLFARFARDTVLVGHNVGFDMRFLRAAEAGAGVRLAQPVLDTLLLDAALHPDHEDHSLEAIAGRLGVEVVGRHTAVGDALLTGEIFIRLLTLLQQQGLGTLGAALTASRATYQARLDARLYGS